jgi:hypothetical protein
MVRSPKLTATKKTVLALHLVSIKASCILKIHPVKAGSKVITVLDDYPTITALIGNATDGDTDISNIILTAHNSLMTPFNIDSVTVEPSESVSPSPSPSPSPSASPTATPLPTDMKPLPTALFAAVAIIACVFGFGLIVNLVAGKKERKT